MKLGSELFWTVLSAGKARLKQINWALFVAHLKWDDLEEKDKEEEGVQKASELMGG